jgi:hypothetical protein
MDTKQLRNAIPLEQPALISGELVQLWLSLVARRWSTLLLVPAAGVESTLPLATALLQVNRRAALDARCSLVDATRISLERAPSLASTVAGRVLQGQRVLVPVDELESNPAALAIAARCNAALLCLALDRSDLRSARRTLERCGPARFVGSVLLAPRQSAL